MATSNYRSDRSHISCSCDEARSSVLSRIADPVRQLLPLADVYGLISADPVVAVEPSPKFDTSAMDGLAVRSADTIGASEQSSLTLVVVGAVPAGRGAPALDQPAACLRIMTGAPFPVGADAVIPFELARQVGDHITVTCPAVPGTNIRLAGEDVSPGDLLVAQGDRLGPAQIALLASQGIEQVAVFPPPRVVIFVTGDELTKSGNVPAIATIRDSNSLMLATLVQSMGGNVVSASRMGDDPAELLAAISDSIQGGADLIVTVGGASAGDRDVVSDLISLGVELQLLDVRMKPGRPLVCGTINGVPLIGLPGNPAAAFVSAMQFVQPAIQKLLGSRFSVWAGVIATVTNDIANAGGRRNFIRVTLDRVDGIVMATPAGPQNAANLLTLARADGLLVIPESLEQVHAGDQLPVQLMPGSPFGTDALLPYV